ncbi:SDR family NAD(P)-dependent oxidoreductase [Deminuibacter soli]|uniref:3-oxoacyl-ACP reductase FabG n=1 Tax=Deminuibacter soli TaxID=2291815 RepID=A0A3E1NHI5_9BACT|nr:3-oxoacyl-ACP reductase family protein [Deminuibacter soli]RFM27413.1 3-oxoacyl-ACP reductase FabG [Deminuibacter soli]
MQRLQNKVALVTGGSRGIGAAIVKRLAAEGAAVAFTFVHNEAKAQEVVAQVVADGGRAIAIKADNTNAAELTAAVDKAAAQLGALDILVNNAGIFSAKPVDAYSLAEFDEMMSVNVRAVFIAVQAALKHLPAGGRIVTIGSNVSVRPGRPGMSVYAMSKSALIGLTRGLARDLGTRKITVNLVEPGPTDTDMNPATGEKADLLRQAMAIPQYGKASDIAAMVALLASGDGSFATGAVLTVDGGLTA